MTGQTGPDAESDESISTPQPISQGRCQTRDDIAAPARSAAAEHDASTSTSPAPQPISQESGRSSDKVARPGSSHYAVCPSYRSRPTRMLPHALVYTSNYWASVSPVLDVLDLRAMREHHLDDEDVPEYYKILVRTIQAAVSNALDVFWWIPEQIAQARRKSSAKACAVQISRALTVAECCVCLSGVQEGLTCDDLVTRLETAAKMTPRPFSCKKNSPRFRWICHPSSFGASLPNQLLPVRQLRHMIPKVEVCGRKQILILCRAIEELTTEMRARYPRIPGLVEPSTFDELLNHTCQIRKQSKNSTGSRSTTVACCAGASRRV